MKKLIYCNNCKYYGHEGGMVGNVCHNPVVNKHKEKYRRKSNIKNWYDDMYVFPENVNINNDCKYYKEDKREINHLEEVIIDAKSDAETSDWDIIKGIILLFMGICVVTGLMFYIACMDIMFELKFFICIGILMVGSYLINLVVSFFDKKRIKRYKEKYNLN